MNQIDKEVEVITTDNETIGGEVREFAVLDYDDQPYGDDNVLVRSLKRRALLASSLIL
jgi:hypothetical protein